MKRGWNLAWRYLDMCSFRFCLAARVKIANLVIWCPYNEPISGFKLRELYKVFTAAKDPFCWNLIVQASLLHSKDFRVLMIADLLYGIPISPKSGSKDRSMKRILATFFITVSCFLTLFFLLYHVFCSMFSFSLRRELSPVNWQSFGNYFCGDWKIVLFNFILRNIFLNKKFTGFHVNYNSFCQLFTVQIL